MVTGNHTEQGSKTQRGPRTAYLTLPLMSLVVIVQATLLTRLHISSGISPNLLLVFVVTWGLLMGIEAGMLWGFVGGLVFDLVAALPLGTSSLALMTICFLSGLGESNLFQGNIFLPVILVALATPIYGAIVLLAQQVRGLQVAWLNVALHVMLPEMLMNVAAVILVYPALRWLARQLGAERMDW